jgi:hypothetical protein
VQIDIGADDHDHLITPEERFKVSDGAAVVPDKVSAADAAPKSPGRVVYPK